MKNVALSFSVSVLVLSATSSSAGDLSPTDPDFRLEVSENGLETIEYLVRDAVAPLPERSGTRISGTTVWGTPIYGAAPDWQNDIRRQIGGVEVADLNGDGLLDVVAVCYNSSAFPPYDDWHNFIYFNTGSELEASPSWISSDQIHAGDVQVGDIDGDTLPDVFSANGGSAMSPSVIYFGAAGGPATSPGWTAADDSWTNHAVLFDVDHDGDLDVATANQGNSEIDPHRPMYLFTNDGGTLATLPSWQSDEISIQNSLSVGDLDGDGWEDLAVAKWIGFESAIYQNNVGSLATTPVWTSGDTGADRGVAWANMDGDEDPDLALGRDEPATQLYRNDAGVLSPVWNGSNPLSGPQDLIWCDVDLDGDPDLVEVYFGSGVVDLYLNRNGALETTPAWSFDSSAVGTGLGCGDINGDGLPDLVVANAGDVSLMVFYNQLDPAQFLPIFVDGFESGDPSAWMVP